MTQQFHEGEEVEVFKIITPPAYGRWRKAKVVKLAGTADLPDCGGVNWYEVQFPDGTRGVFDAEHIRAKIHRPDGGRNDAFPSDYECANGDCE